MATLKFAKSAALVSIKNSKNDTGKVKESIKIEKMAEEIKFLKQVLRIKNTGTGGVSNLVYKIKELEKENLKLKKSKNKDLNDFKSNYSSRFSDSGLNFSKKGIPFQHNELLESKGIQIEQKNNLSQQDEFSEDNINLDSRLGSPTNQSNRDDFSEFGFREISDIDTVKNYPNKLK